MSIGNDYDAELRRLRGLVGEESFEVSPTGSIPDGGHPKLAEALEQATSDFSGGLQIDGLDTEKLAAALESRAAHPVGASATFLPKVAAICVLAEAEAAALDALDGGEG